MLNSELKQKSYLTEDEIDSFFDRDTGNNYRSVKKGRKPKKIKSDNSNQFRLELKDIRPLTKTQSNIFKAFQETDQNLFLHGYAGTGKSFISCYLMMKELFSNQSYDKVLIVRSTVPSRDQGFLPGNAAEKAKIYELPYHGIFQNLFGRSDAYDQFKKKRQIEFESTSYLRGTTYDNCLILVDEIQNMTRQEISTVITRVGQNCRLIMSGDFHQTDLLRDNEKKGMLEIFKILKSMRSVDFIEFKREDIVRSNFVKEFIIAEHEYKKNNY